MCDVEWRMASIVRQWKEMAYRLSQGKPISVTHYRNRVCDIETSLNHAKEYGQIRLGYWAEKLMEVKYPGDKCPCGERVKIAPKAVKRRVEAKPYDEEEDEDSPHPPSYSDFLELCSNKGEKRVLWFPQKFLCGKRDPVRCKKTVLAIVVKTVTSKIPRYELLLTEAGVVRHLVSIEDLDVVRKDDFKNDWFEEPSQDYRMYQARPGEFRTFDHQYECLKALYDREHCQ